MSFDQFLILMLMVLSVCQFIFWSMMVSRLENKLMSRDFHNYVDSQKPKELKTNFKLQSDDIDLNSEIRPF